MTIKTSKQSTTTKPATKQKPSKRKPVEQDGAAYLDVLEHMRGRFAAIDGPLFNTPTKGLFDAWLNALPPELRQHYNCNTCRSFVRKYGGLVTVDERGQTRSAFWSELGIQSYHGPAIKALRLAVERGKVHSVFYSSATEWGIAETGEWNHFAVIPAYQRVHRDKLKTAWQASAEKTEEYKMVARAIASYSATTVHKVIALLKSGTLSRSEKFIGPAEWLLDLHKSRDALLSDVQSHGSQKLARENLIWRAIATAPTGFAHIRGSVVGSLLQDMSSGMSTDAIRRRYEEKLHPLQYQRPQTPPSAGNIKQAEDVVAKLGIERSLKRRFARLDEIETVWTPSKPAKPVKKGGVFAHLTEAQDDALTIRDAVTMTWEKFMRTVMPSAHEISVYVNARDHFCAYVTAEDPEAPPILKWDGITMRNPVNWYVWHGGSAATQWGLRSGTWAKLSAISLQPTMWFDPGTYAALGKGALLVIEGARETRKAGLALFPENLRSDLHGIRATIEAFSQRGELGGIEQGSACGLRVEGMNGAAMDIRLRVTAGDVVSHYRIDRWD